MRTSEWWLGKLGIGLLLFGVIFLFKYSIDQGWITPALRIAFGLAIGAALLFFGFRIYSKRRHFSLLLFGGGMATFYICGFAAFQIFSLVSHLTAFAFMIVVTLLAFFLSLRQNEAILSLVGTVGGLGTPFLLYTGEGNLPGLVAYTCLILAGSGSVYFYKGWRSLLWLSVAGGWIVFLIGLWGLPYASYISAYNALGDRWALQAGVIFGWLTFWCMPVVRDFLGATQAGIFEHTYLGFNSEKPESDGKTFLNRYAHAFTISTPLIAFFISRQTWSQLPDQTWGFVEMGFAALYVLIWRQLSKTEPLIKLAQTHLFTAAILLTISLSDLFDGHTLLYALATEALVLRLLANRFDSRMFSFGSHLIFGFVALWLTDRLGLYDFLNTGRISSGSGTPILNALAIANLYAIALSFATVVLLRAKDARRIYFLVAFAALAALTIREFDGNVLLVLLGLETVLLHLIARFTVDDVYIGAAADIFSAGVALWLGERLLFHSGYDLSVFNAQALADLSFLGLLFLISTFFPRKEEQNIYRLFVHLALLAWFSRELSHLPNGQGFVSAAWGLYAIGLLIAGLRRNIRALRLVGLATILLVVAKLFIIDLARLETLWRILLFIGFGGLFLVISYYFKSMWKQPVESDDKS